MKCKLIAIILLLAGIASATPVVDPAPLFTGWPWVDGGSQWWQAAESNRIVKQVWLSLEDRARACGVTDAPYHSQAFRFSAGIKTNWMHEDWTFWNPGTTNNVKTNYYPRLGLTYEQQRVNDISPFEYYYPTNVDIDFSGVASGTSYVYVSRQMCDSITNTLVSICTNYVPSSFTNNLEGESNIPHYIFGGVLVDAGYSSYVSDIVTNYQGVITNCTWMWPSELPSNGVLTLGTFDMLAACIAQLKTVAIRGLPCNPARFYYNAGIGPYYGRGGDWAVETTITNEFVIANDTVNSFAWIAQSFDEIWYSTITISSNEWNQGTNETDTSLVLNYTVTPHSDWPSNGWFGALVADVGMTASRTNNDGTAWNVVVEGVGNSLSQTNTGLSMSKDVQWGVAFGGIPDTSYTGGVRVSSYYSEDGYDTLPEYWAQLTTNTITLEDNSTYVNMDNTTTTFTRFHDASATVAVTYVCTGYFDRHTNDTHNTRWTDFVSFTNQQNVTNQTQWYAVTSTTTRSTITNLFIVTNVTQSAAGSNLVPEQLFVNPTGNFVQVSSGTVDMVGFSYENGLLARADIYSLKPNLFVIYTNLTGTANVYLRGCPRGRYGAHDAGTTDTKPDDWRNYTWRFTNSVGAEISISSAAVLQSNTFVNVFSFDLPDDCFQDFWGNPMIKYTDMYDQSGGYIPYYYGDEPRMFWGVDEAWFVMGYTFTNRF
jgi:hypothetical protein